MYFVNILIGCFACLGSTTRQLDTHNLGSWILIARPFKLNCITLSYYSALIVVVALGISSIRIRINSHLLRNSQMLLYSWGMGSILLAREFGTRECPGRAQVGWISRNHVVLMLALISLCSHLRNNRMVCDASTDNLLTGMLVQGQL